VLSVLSDTRALRRASAARLPTGAELAVLVGGALCAWAAAGALDELEVPTAAVVAGGLFLCALLGLTLARFETTVALAVLLLAFVRFEPAPVDVAFAVLIAVSFVTGRFHLRQMPLAVFALLGTLLAITVLSSIAAVDPVRAVTYFLITAYLVALAVWLTTYVQSLNQMRLIVRMYVAGAIATAIPAILALFVSFPGSEHLVYGEDRAKGLFKDPNVFGPFLIVALLIVVGELLSPRLLKSGRLAKALMGFVLLAGVFFSYSRAAWLGLAIGLAAMVPVLALRRRGGRQAMALLVAAVVATIGISVVVAVSNSGDFLRERARLQAYDTERFGAQASGAELAWEHPLGIGPGQFEQVADYAAHSSYVRALAEQGVAGAAVLVALMLTTLVLALRNVATGRSTYGLGSATLFGAWCAILVNSAFVDTLHWRHLWLVAALIWIGAMRRAPAAA
jgi:O-antigen ligase